MTTIACMLVHAINPKSKLNLNVLIYTDCSADESNTTRRTPNVTVTEMDLRSAIY